MLYGRQLQDVVVYIFLRGSVNLNRPCSFAPDVFWPVKIGLLNFLLSHQSLWPTFQSVVAIIGGVFGVRLECGYLRAVSTHTVRTRMNGHLLALMMQRHKLASDMRFQLLFNQAMRH
ncbi:MAG: hypothetical protein ACJA13_004218 [Paraglaciecola sp.]